MRMPGWYDIIDFGSLTANEDENGIKSSYQILQGIITEQVRDHSISSKRIILGGFSQGAVVSLFTGLTSEMSLGDANRKTPIFMGHGKVDPLVQHSWGSMSRDILLKQKCDVEWHEYDGLAHSADPEEINDLEKWIVNCLKKSPADSSKSEL
ncbi:hypothetical protein AA313_de0202962 [Arthrobotrys entomopaga]|nr:hypothetical protein AA313_de0202962 [Arthrobotrys entomopaga]